MRAKGLVYVMTALTLTAAVATAGQSPECPEQPQKNEDVRRTGSTLIKLGHFTDAWHLANLKNDKDKVFQFEMQMLQLLREDLTRCSKFVGACREQLEHLQEGTPEHSEKLLQVHYVDSCLKAKTRLLGGITRTTAFSAKLRLFGNYSELLRNELDRNLMHLAATDLPHPADEKK